MLKLEKQNEDEHVKEEEWIRESKAEGAPGWQCWRSQATALQAQVMGSVNTLLFLGLMNFNIKRRHL